MAPSRNNVLALLGLVISVHALPAAIPTPSDKIVLGPPSYWVSWDLPKPTDEPETPAPYFPVKPSDQISLSPPSYSVSWDPGYPAPTTAPEEPEPEEPEIPPYTSNIISLSPPSQSVSWDLSPAPTNPPKEESPVYPQPKPSDQISLGPPSFSVTWDADPAPTPTPEQPGPSKPSDQITLGPPSFSVSWDPGYTPPPSTSTKTSKPWPGKPTYRPVPWPPRPKPTNQFSLGKPSATISWAKRQGDEPEPTDFPEFPEDPEPEPPGGPIIIPPFPWPTTPPNTIGIEPPKASISWGKREPEPAANTIGLEFPTAIVSWWTRRPTKTANVSWGKREAEATEAPAAVEARQIGLFPPKQSVSWGRRDAEPQLVLPTNANGNVGQPSNSYGIVLPTGITIPEVPTLSSAYISWGKREGGAEATPAPERRSE